MIENAARFLTVPITVQAGLRVRKLALHSNRSYSYGLSEETVGCAMRTAHLQFGGRFWCARRTLRSWAGEDQPEP